MAEYLEGVAVGVNRESCLDPATPTKPEMEHRTDCTCTDPTLLRPRYSSLPAGGLQSQCCGVARGKTASPAFPARVEVFASALELARRACGSGCACFEIK